MDSTDDIFVAGHLGKKWFLISPRSGSRDDNGGFRNGMKEKKIVSNAPTCSVS